MITDHTDSFIIMSDFWLEITLLSSVHLIIHECISELMLRCKKQILNVDKERSAQLFSDALIEFIIFQTFKNFWTAVIDTDDTQNLHYSVILLLQISDLMNHDLLNSFNMHLILAAVIQIMTDTLIVDWLVFIALSLTQNRWSGQWYNHIITT